MNATDKLQATVRTLGIKIRIMSALTPPRQGSRKRQRDRDLAGLSGIGGI